MYTFDEIKFFCMLNYLTPHVFIIWKLCRSQLLSSGFGHNSSVEGGLATPCISVFFVQRCDAELLQVLRERDKFLHSWNQTSILAAYRHTDQQSKLLLTQLHSFVYIAVASVRVIVGYKYFVFCLFPKESNWNFVCMSYIFVAVSPTLLRA